MNCKKYNSEMCYVMAPTKKMNADYCREYRRKHASKYKAKDKERKQFERDCLGAKIQKY